ncbi:MAG TPA: helix-turn-helix transcriptional regulator [Candidatus Aquicultor sp.]|jgi:DNA-binding CsgD family transcriptional regulator
MGNTLIATIFGIRAICLINVLIIAIFGTKPGPVYLFVLIILYNVLLFLVWNSKKDSFQPGIWFILSDVFVSAIALWLSGSTSNSPYFPYVFTSLMVVGSFSKLCTSFLITVWFALLFTAGLLKAGSIVAMIARNNMDTLIGNYIAFFLVSFFFGYPASIIRQAEEAGQMAGQARASAMEIRMLSDELRCDALLTPREKEIARFLCRGIAAKDIAKELFIAECTVKNHSRNIYKKLGINNRVSLMLLYENGEG